MKLTKIKIEEMANEIMEFLKEKDLSNDVSIYFNNKRMNKDGVEEGEFNPKNYFEYAADNHILSMSFEGELNYILNHHLLSTYCNKIINNFNNIIKKYGVYYEMGNGWNLTCYPIYSDMEIEYTYYDKKPDSEPIRIYDMNQVNDYPEIKNIMIAWYELSRQTGDIGSCTIGDGFEFMYKERRYFLCPCSPFQGSVSYEKHIETIKIMLANIGAKDIVYNYGCLD